MSSCGSCTDSEHFASTITRCSLCGELFCASHEQPKNHRCRELIKETETNLDILVRDLSKRDEKHVWETEMFRARRLMRQRGRSHSSTTETENCLRLQMSYLWLFEGEYTAGIIDTLCSLLTANGKRLYNYRGRAAQTMTDIGDVALCDKFYFLENNGFSGITRLDFKFIRDCIAHQNVLTLDDNRILVPRNRQKVKMRNKACDKDEINIEIKLRELQEFIDEMDGKLADLIKKYSPEVRV